MQKLLIDKIFIESKTLEYNIVIHKTNYQGQEMYIGFVKSLYLTSKGRTIERLEQSMNHVLTNFFNFYNTDEKLKKELIRMGWLNDEFMYLGSVEEDLVFVESRKYKINF